MLKASSWQWGKYKEKTKLLKTYEHNYEAREIEDYTKLEINLYRKVILLGEFNYENQFLIANRKDITGPGFWLLTEFKLRNQKKININKSIIVSRGFIPFKDRDNLEKYNYNQPNLIQAVIQKSIPQKSFLSPSESKNKHIYLYPDINKICIKHAINCVDTTYYAQKIKMAKEPIFPKESISIQVPPSTHYGYTFEWIILALITLFLSTFAQLYPKKLSKIFSSRSFRLSAKKGSGASMFFSVFLLLAIIFNILFLPGKSYATEKHTEVPKDALIKEHLGNQIDLELSFTLQNGKRTTISELLSKNKPLIIAPLYFECPRLCTLSQSGLLETINKNKLKLGDDYEVVSISFNEKDTHESAFKYAEVYRSKLTETLNKSAWQFAVTDKETIAKLMKGIGFSFKEDKGQFIHSAGMIILTPKGVISRYFYGIQFPPNQLRLALLEAAKGKIGSSFDRIMMFCFRFDPTKGKYTLAVWNITRVLCTAFAIALVGFIFYLKRKEKEE